MASLKVIAFYTFSWGVSLKPAWNPVKTPQRKSQAKSWELRAATSLSRLWRQQGKGVEAYELLAPVYGWFAEGFDTADLQEAKALLEALS
jgi:predicted ATPase